MRLSLSSFSAGFYQQPLEALTDADYKRAWVDARFDELKGKKRMSYAAIGRKMGGLTRQYIQQVANGYPAGDEFISKMAEAFGFDLPVPPGARPILDIVSTPTNGEPPELTPVEVELLKMIDKLETRVKTLTEKQDTQAATHANLLNAVYQLLQAHGLKLDELTALVSQKDPAT